MSSSMDLILVYNDPSRTLLINRDGIAMYSIDTPSTPLTVATVVTRIAREAGAGLVATEVGKIEYRDSHGARLFLCDGNVDLVLNPLDPHNQDVDNSWAFSGPDNLPYKWQVFIQSPILFLNDNSLTPLARYRRAKLGIVSRSRKAFLEIFPAGINIIDLIVVTFVSFMKQRVAIEYLHSNHGE